MPFPHQAVVRLFKSGGLHRVESFLQEEGSSIHEVSDMGRSILTLAVKFGSAEDVRQLISRGVDPNVGHGAVWAAATSSTDVLKLLLEAGADPTVVWDGGESPMQAAIAYRKHENVQLLRKYAKPFLENKKGPSLVMKRSRQRLDPALNRHAEGLRRVFQEERRWEVLAVRDSVEEVCNCFPDRPVHTDAHKRLVPEEVSQLFILRMKGMPWTLCIKRLGTYSLEGREWIRSCAHAWSSTLGETVGFWGLQAFHYAHGNLSGEHSWAIDDVDDDRLDEDEDEDVVDQIEADLFAQMDDWLTSTDLLLPGMEDVSDGYSRKLAVFGVKKSHVEEMAIVDLEPYD
ncbi:MAG: ankyrin repeat domain-containing protein [Myxococcota bacterium]